MEGRIFLTLLFGLYLLNGQGTFALSSSTTVVTSPTTPTVTTPGATPTTTSDSSSTVASSSATTATSTTDTTPTTLKPTPAPASTSPATTTELSSTPSATASVTTGETTTTESTATTAKPMGTSTATPDLSSSTDTKTSATTPTDTTATSSEAPSTGNSTATASSPGAPPTGNSTATASSPGAPPTVNSTSTESSPGAPPTVNSTSTESSPGAPPTGNSTATASSPGAPPTGNSVSAESTTVPPSTGTSTSTVSSTVLTTTGDFCVYNPCKTDAATCINIKGGRVCRCPYGYYYDENICTQGKQFFGTVNLKKEYAANVVEPGSEAYRELYKDVLVIFARCFENQTDYEQTIITKISYFSNSKRFSKAAPRTVIEINNIFTSSSNITEDEVIKAIETAAIKDPLLSNFTKSNLCNSPYCDEATTNCQPLQNGSFANCKCKDGFFKESYELTTCKDCAPSCSKENFKECVQIRGGGGLVPSCQCLADFQFDKEKKNCVLCDFGYSGKNCQDDFLLILVIVGVVLGALLLGLLGAVIGLSVKSNRKSKTPDRERLIDHEVNPVFGSGTSTNGSLFPKVRAKPTVNANVATMNPYTSDDTFQRSVPTRDYDDDNDSWYEMSAKDNRHGNQSKY